MPEPFNRADDEDVLRITVGNDVENDTVITALTEYVSQGWAYASPADDADDADDAEERRYVLMKNTAFS